MFGRILRAGLAFLLGLVLLESSLRVAGAIYLARGGRGGEGDTPDAALTVACLGDSNVFGLFCAEEESYPARLQALLDAGQPDRDAAVWNLGRPGLDTYGALERLDRTLALSPDVLLLTIGVNNDWSFAGDAEAGADAPWYEELRIAKLLRIVAGRVSAPTDDTVRRRGGDRLEGDAQEASIRRDVGKIAQRVRESGVELVLVTYGAERSKYAVANRALRAAAREANVPLIDPTPACLALAERLGFGAVYFPDLHPRPCAYEVIARVVYNALLARGVAEGHPVADPLADLSESAGSPIRIALTGSLAGPEELAIEVSGGPPGEAFSLFLWGPHREPEPPAEANFVTDPLAQFVREAGGLRGTFDAGGVARVPVAEMFSRYPAPEALDGLRMWSTCLPRGEADEAGASRGVVPPPPEALVLR